MTDTPNVGAPEWAAAQATPWLQANKRARIWDAFAVRAIVEEMNRNTPPVSCADGARYHVGSSPTGAFVGHDGEMMVASGTDASNGWIPAIVETEGVQLYDRSTGDHLEWNGSAWVLSGSGLVAGASIGDLSDVDLTGLADGFVLKYDLSNGQFYPAPDLDSDTDTGISRIQDATDFGSGGAGLIDGYVLVWDESNQLFYLAPPSSQTAQEWAPNFTDDGDVYIPAAVAMTIDQGNAPVGTGSLAYEKSTAGAPGTFAATSLPATLQAGAWLKVSASSVTGFLAAHLVQTG